MYGLEDSYYRLALSCAQRRDLAAAVRYAQSALCFNAQNKRASRLLGLCLYELGEPVPTTYKNLTKDKALIEASEEHERTRAVMVIISDCTRSKRFLKAEAIARKISHQSARILVIRGCLLASAGKYGKAAKLFSAALEKDRGNVLTSAFLTEALKRRRYFWEKM